MNLAKREVWNTVQSYLKRQGTIDLYQTSINIWEDHVNEIEFERVYGFAIRCLRDRGFKVKKDPLIRKQYPILAPHRHHARKKHLEVKLSLSGRHISIEFYQNLNYENPNGGQYDFDKHKKMPYLVRLSFIIEAAKLMESLVNEFGYVRGKNISLEPAGTPMVRRVLTAIKGINGAKEPLRRFNESWGTERFLRDESGWPAFTVYTSPYNNDREGVPLRNGMFRYYRGNDGYLKRGRIFTNMNTMWQLIYGPGHEDVTWVNCSDLFSLQPTDSFKRQISPRRRKQVLVNLKKRAVEEENYERAAILRDIISSKK